MLYFAYGSNLNHEQMQERCKDSKYIKNVFLEGYKLSFCAVSRSYGVANIVKKTGSKVPGGLWKISARDEKEDSEEKEIDLKGVGIWALGYDEGRSELWGAIYEQFYSELLGDLNDDQIVNVLDVILLVNMILDLSPLQYIADINGDGNVDVLDVIIIVNIIIQTL